MNKGITLFLVLAGIYSCKVKEYKAEERYLNGQMVYQGNYIKCSERSALIPSLTEISEKKIGEWILYYPNGNIKEIRNYTSNVESCEDTIYREGKWEFFNELGQKYHEEIYENDKLLYAEIPIFRVDSQVGKVIKNQFYDSIFYFNEQISGHLVTNGNFDTYLYPPIEISFDGHNKIQETILNWYSPDSGTPDYFSQVRSVSGVPFPSANI